MRAILYPRISLEEGNQYGLPSQLRALREYAKAKSYTVVAELAEEYTGKTLDRPQLNRIREMARRREFDVLVAHSLDRLTRRMGQLVALRDELSQHRVSIEYVLMPTDDSIESRVMQTISEAFADYEREKIYERTLRGRREKARRGFIVGGRVPYGYDYLTGQLRINEERAAVVRRIFAWIESGISIREIARRLRRERIPTSLGGRWGHSSVRRILTNETYCGLAHYGTHKREGKLLRIRQGGERISIAVPAILSRELWEKAQAILAANTRRHNGRPTRRYLLRGILYCSCGCKMYGEPAHGYPRYRCQGREKETEPRCLRAAKSSVLDDLVWSAVSSAFANPKTLRRLVAENFEAVRSEGGAERGQDLTKQIAVLKAREDRALALLLELEDSREELMHRYQQARKERLALEGDLAGIERARQGAAAAEESIDSLVREVSAGLRDLSPEDRGEFLGRLVERITWDGETAAIRCFLVARKCADHQDVVYVSERLYFTLKARLAA